ncbi:MAG: SDR family NAD(P)-dependent oxidoreductase [Saprospiraceae bacterium]
MKLLLIGMGPGMGLSIARRFGRAGFEILMMARNADKLRQLSDTLKAEGIASQGFPADIADPDAFRAALDQVVQAHPDIDILHYNASAYNPALPSEIRLDVFLSDLNVNVTGALLAAQAVLPQMRARGAGVLFLTGGGTALRAPAMLASLGVGKAAMRNLAFSLYDECGPQGIRVATVTIRGMIAPGTAFDPDAIAGKFWEMYEQRAEKWEAEVMW